MEPVKKKPRQLSSTFKTCEDMVTQRRQDRLSALPDPLTQNILSHMTMPQVIKTSLLSSKWRYRWASVPFLTFDRVNSTDTICSYNKFVDLVLFFRDSSTIHTFRLIWKKDHCDPSDIDSWIRVAVHRKVEHLSLQFHPTGGSSVFPHCLFTSMSLTNFSLCMSDDSLFPGQLDLIPFPNRINLPSLKTLDLRYVTFMNGSFLEKLLGGCPALERLVLVKCRTVASSVLTISAVRLKYLVLELCYNDPETEEKDLEIVVSAPNLITFLWTDTLWTKCVIDNLSVLEVAMVNMQIGFFDQNGRTIINRGNAYANDGDVNSMIKCLRSLYNVRSLTLSSFFLEVISGYGHPSTLENWPTRFTNLKDLYLGTRLTIGCFRAIIFLLNNAANVRRLVLQINQTKRNAGNMPEHGALESTLKISLDHLQYIEFREVTGCMEELYLVKLLLNNAVALKRISFFLPVKWTYIDEERKKNLDVFAKQVGEIPRLSDAELRLYGPQKNA